MNFCILSIIKVILHAVFSIIRLAQTMKKLIPAIITLCASMLAGCQIDDEMHTVYDVYYKTAFVTDSTNAVLSCAAKASILSI